MESSRLLTATDSRHWYSPFHWRRLGEGENNSIELNNGVNGPARRWKSTVTTSRPPTFTPLLWPRYSRCSLDEQSQSLTETCSLKNDEHKTEWVRGALLCARCALAVLILNVFLITAAAAVSYSKFGWQGFFSAVLYQGKCSVSKYSAMVIHLATNVLGTIMLATSNYCMQCLSAPTREDVDRAHKRRVWLDVGVPSVRNLFALEKWWKPWLWIVLLSTSLPIHMIYNSAAHHSLGPTKYPIIAVPLHTNFEQALTGTADFESCFNKTAFKDISTYYDAVARGQFNRLSKSECIDNFAVDYLSGQGVLVLVSSDMPSREDSMVYVNHGYHPHSVRSAFQWMCPQKEIECSLNLIRKQIHNWSVRVPRYWSADELELREPGPSGSETLSIPEWVSNSENPSDLERLRQLINQNRDAGELQADLDNAGIWENSTWAREIDVEKVGTKCSTDIPLTEMYEIDHCLSKKVEETCRLIFSPLICILLIVCDVFKVGCMFYIAHDKSKDVLMNVGDAISSFLSHPDPVTNNTGLLSKSIISNGFQGWRSAFPILFGVFGAFGSRRLREEPHRVSPGRLRWLRAPSVGRWFSAVALWGFVLGATSFCLQRAVYRVREADDSASFWDYNLGTASPRTVIAALTRAATGRSIVFMALLANTPQLLVSFAYFLDNALLTNMLLAVEYDGYSVQRKTLRVTRPKGAQRSTYYLTLPYKCSIPLLIMFTLLHWLVSQSIFLIDILGFDIGGNPIDGSEIVTLGYSPVAIIYAMVAAILLLCLPVALGLRRFRSRIPLAVSCSAAISAACHPYTEGVGDHALKPVMWGEIMQKNNTRNSNTDDGVGFWDSPYGQYGYAFPSAEEFEAAQRYHCSFTSEEVIAPSLDKLYV